MYQAIVFLPLLGAIIAGLFGRVIGARASEIAVLRYGLKQQPHLSFERLLSGPGLALIYRALKKLVHPRKFLHLGFELLKPC